MDKSTKISPRVHRACHGSCWSAACGWPVQLTFTTESVRGAHCNPRKHEIVYGIVPQVLPLFLSYVLYRLESNIRAATVLGFVGAGGIGAAVIPALAGAGIGRLTIKKRGVDVVPEQLRRRYEQTRDVVTALQQELLPAGLPVLPGVRIAAHYLATAGHERVLAEARELYRALVDRSLQRGFPVAQP